MFASRNANPPNKPPAGPRVSSAPDRTDNRWVRVLSTALAGWVMGVARSDRGLRRAPDFAQGGFDETTAPVAPEGCPSSLGVRTQRKPGESVPCIPPYEGRIREPRGFPGQKPDRAQSR